VFKVEVFVSLRESILDPQGKAVQNAVHHLGYNSVSDLRIGKYITFSIEENSRDLVEKKVKEICEKLLHNAVMENYSFTIKPCVE
jgi:phosphoribosylformylglycinamidine synthase